MVEGKFGKTKFTAGSIALIAGIALFAVKFYAYTVTGSKAVLSDALENIVNIVTAITSLTVVIVGSKPADRDHPYGHGKVEHFAAAFEGGAITFAGSLIVFEAVNSLISGSTLKELNTGLIIVSMAGLANGALGLYLKQIGRKTGSVALAASGVHVLSDFYTSAGVVAGLVLVKLTGIVLFDSIVAGLVGAHLIWQGIKILIKSGSELLDAEDVSVILQLGKLFEKHIFPGIIRAHYTRVIRSGHYHHVDMHVVVPEFWTVEMAHNKTGIFETNVMTEYSAEGELHLHLDPCRRAYCEVCDYPGCPVRAKQFKQRLPFTVEELTSPKEPDHFS